MEHPQLGTKADSDMQWTIRLHLTGGKITGKANNTAYQ
jgi:hypothetical protein